MIKKLTESFYDDIRDEIVMTVEHSLDRKGVYASVWDEDSLDDNEFVLYVEIENGDWKHQHLFADNVVIDTVIDKYPDMDIEKIDEEVTADDGSDTYSAIHMFKITNTLDECCRESTNRKFSRRKSVKEYYDIDTVQAYAYKIYNDMTDDNTFIISKDKQRAKEYGKKLADIYRNYDEDTIDIDIDEYYNSLPNNVIVTNPEYWTDRKERSNGHWIVTNYDDVNYDDNLSFDLTIIGDYSDRF